MDVDLDVDLDLGCPDQDGPLQKVHEFDLMDRVHAPLPLTSLQFTPSPLWRSSAATIASPKSSKKLVPEWKIASSPPCFCAAPSPSPGILRGAPAATPDGEEDEHETITQARVVTRASSRRRRTSSALRIAQARSQRPPPPHAVRARVRSRDRPRPPALARPFRRPPPAAHARLGACAGPFSTSSAAATCINRPRTLPCVRGPVLDAQGHCRLHHPPAARTPMRLRCPGPPPPASARARSHTCAGSFSTSSAADSWTAAAASACFDARCLRCVRGLVHAPPPLLLPTAPCTLPCVRGLAHATAAAASATSAARARSHACAGSLMRPPPPLAVSTPAAPRTLPCVCELAHATAAAACFDTHRPAHAPMRAQPLPISTPVARARRPDACAGSVLRRCRRSFQHPRTLPCARGLAHATAAAPATLCMRGLAHASAAAARFKVRCPCTPRCVRGLAHTPNVAATHDSSQRLRQHYTRRHRRSFQHPRTLPCARGLAHATAPAPATPCTLPCMRGLAHASAAADAHSISAGPRACAGSLMRLPLPVSTPAAPRTLP
ncbi:hypothetical protein GGX14DRAFT_580110 [Mycena pura]|uniref:Uncharacterized protein n=1 Tax=Mycena pura TaxID=153505 RepID=A0AAD6UPN9_9AGAR|nr:hypothetical protein GGX14DRAFT_580110 [Mycena pura]